MVNPLEDLSSLEIKKEPRITTFSATIAKERFSPELNQDSFCVEDGGIAIFDGMGGHFGGQAASIAEKEFFSPYLQEIREQNPLEVAAELVSKLQESVGFVYEKTTTGGTTATVVKFVTHQSRLRAVIGHVGDSAAYLERSGKTYKITAEDAYWHGFHFKDPYKIKEIQKRLDNVVTPQDYQNLSEEEKVYFSRRASIGQAIIKNRVIEPHIYFLTLEKGDKIIIGSDGLSDNYTDEMIEEDLKLKPFNPAGALAESVYDYSRLHIPNLQVKDQPYPRAKPDDITVVVTEIDEAGEQLITEGLSDKFEKLPTKTPEFIPFKDNFDIQLGRDSTAVHLKVLSAEALAVLSRDMGIDMIDTPFALVDVGLFATTNGERGYTGLNFYSEPKVLGREPSVERLKDRFDLSDNVSRQHLKIGLVGNEDFPELYLEDLGSKNGTYVKNS